MTNVRNDVFLLAVFTLLAAPAYAGVGGLWECRESGYAYTLKLEESDGCFTGVATFRADIGKQSITSGKVDGNRIYFIRDPEAQHITHTGTVTGTEITGIATSKSNGKTAKFECSN
jgi:hypothetical protein